MDVGGWAKMEAGDQLGNPHHPSENWWELGPVRESQEIFGGRREEQASWRYWG